MIGGSHSDPTMSSGLSRHERSGEEYKKFSKSCEHERLQSKIVSMKEKKNSCKTATRSVEKFPLILFTRSKNLPVNPSYHL